MLAAHFETAVSDEFKVLRPLAMGGMAEILLARRSRPARPERLVVIKRLHRPLASDPDYVRMFLDEARIAITLRHPNVVEVYERGQTNDQHYIVMEHLHGHDLRRVFRQMALRGVGIRLGQSLAIARGICRGLDYTHERTGADGELLGIVHRDVSPHNVLLTYDGRVKLVDFGIAKANTQVARTRTGILKGKVAYMSPEQALGEPLDRRSDVFCIGILLWEMTTGRLLYRRKSELETLKAVIELDAPRPSLVNPQYPPQLEQIVMKTLARSREDRWATAGELGEALTEFAKRRRLDLSTPKLAEVMSAAFRDETEAWQNAQRAGISLGDHLVAELDRTAPPVQGPDAGAGEDEEEDDSAMDDLPTTVLTPPRRPSTIVPIPVLTQPPTRRSQRVLWIVFAAIVFAIAIGFLADAVRGEARRPDAGTARPPTAPVVNPAIVPPTAPVVVPPTAPAGQAPAPAQPADPAGGTALPAPIVAAPPPGAGPSAGAAKHAPRKPSKTKAAKPVAAPDPEAGAPAPAAPVTTEPTSPAPSP